MLPESGCRERKRPSPPVVLTGERLGEGGSRADREPLEWAAHRGQWFLLRTADLFVFSDVRVLKVLARIKRYWCCSGRSLQHRGDCFRSSSFSRYIQ